MQELACRESTATPAAKIKAQLEQKQQLYMKPALARRFHD